MCTLRIKFWIPPKLCQPDYYHQRVHHIILIDLQSMPSSILLLTAGGTPFCNRVDCHVTDDDHVDNNDACEL